MPNSESSLMQEIQDRMTSLVMPDEEIQRMIHEVVCDLLRIDTEEDVTEDLFLSERYAPTESLVWATLWSRIGGSMLFVTTSSDPDTGEER